MAPGRVADLLQRGRPRATPGLSPIGAEGVEAARCHVETEVERQRGLQAALPNRLTTRKARQRHQRVDALPALRRLTEDVQAIADLRLLELAQVGVQATQQGLAFGIVGRAFEAEFGVQIFLQHALQDVGAQQLGAARV